MADNKRYVDYDGLKLYRELSKAETDLIDVKATEALALLDDLTIEYNIYYMLGTEEGTTYSYEPATGVVLSGRTYYNRSGSGTTEDPYKYTAADPQPEEGTSAEGYYVCNFFVYEEVPEGELASNDYIYYNRTGAGTKADPYVYTRVTLAEGSEAGGYFIRKETTTDTGYPAETSTGEEKTTTTVIIVPTDTNTIQEEQIDSLFPEEE